MRLRLDVPVMRHYQSIIPLDNQYNSTGQYWPVHVAGEAGEGQGGEAGTQLALLRHDPQQRLDASLQTEV